MSIIPLNQVWVDANFKEVQLRNIRIGQPVKLTADVYGSKTEFKGTVVCVETGDFVRKAEDSPNPGHGHHEFGNAETYFLVGDALGKAALKLLPK